MYIPILYNIYSDLFEKQIKSQIISSHCCPLFRIYRMHYTILNRGPNRRIIYNSTVYFKPINHIFLKRNNHMHSWMYVMCCFLQFTMQPESGWEGFFSGTTFYYVLHNLSFKCKPGICQTKATKNASSSSCLLYWHKVTLKV